MSLGAFKSPEFQQLDSSTFGKLISAMVGFPKAVVDVYTWDEFHHIPTIGDKKRVHCIPMVMAKHPPHNVFGIQLNFNCQ